MIYLTDAKRLRPHRGRVVAAIGVFDGVHLGHRTILREMVEYATTERLLSVAVTFEPHPDQVLGRAEGRQRLSTPSGKAAMIGGLGVDAVLALSFDRAFAALQAEQFVQNCLVEPLAPREIFVGFNFTFGNRGSGTADTLRALGRAAGFGVRVFGPLTGNGDVISSSKVRSLLAEGDVARATRLLGRPFRSTGVVVRGDRRGTGLGFPTANVSLPPEMLRPAIGVYAAWAVLGGQVWPAVVNVGRRPTFTPAGEVVLEVHMVGYPGGPAYGECLELIWIARLRDEMKFAGAAELCAQIERDRGQALRLLGRRDHTMAGGVAGSMC